MAEQLATTQHRNILHVLGHGWMTHSQLYFYDMQFCQIDLRKYLSIVSGETNISNTFPLATTEKGLWQIMEDITRGLNFIHSCGQIHGNLKPSNGCPCFCWTDESIFP